MGTSCEKRQCVATERKQIAANCDMGFSKAGAARGQRWGGSVACGLPMFLQISRAPLPSRDHCGPQEAQCCRSVQGTKLVRCRARLQRFPKRAEQGTEIKRPEMQLPAKLLWALGQVGPGPGLGAAREGQEGPQVLKQKAHRKCSSSVTCVSEDGGPCRCMHDYEGEATTGELTR